MSGSSRAGNGGLHKAGPAVVALGGGHGLAASLKALRFYAGSIVGIVSIGDDGGSSGRLREEIGVAPPGDLRRCLSALANNDSLLARSLEHRFDDGSLRGHPIGNLLLTGLSMAAGDLQEAIDEVARLVDAAGVIYPASQVPVTLVADSDRGTLSGQVNVEFADEIRNLRFEPAEPQTSRAATEAIRSADQIIIGPGSLYTSVLAAAVVPAIGEALRQTSAQRVFVANIANEKGDARGFGLAEHLEAVHDHGVPIDVVVAASGVAKADVSLGTLVEADLAAADGWSHDPVKLGATLSKIYENQIHKGKPSPNVTSRST